MLSEFADEIFTSFVEVGFVLVCSAEKETGLIMNYELVTWVILPYPTMIIV